MHRSNLNNFDDRSPFKKPESPNNMLLPPKKIGKPQHEHTDVLKTYFLRNLSYPYPPQDIDEMKELMKATTLDEKQIISWFRYERSKSGISEFLSTGEVSHQLACYLTEHGIKQLPERGDARLDNQSIQVLRDWFNKNLSDPYPDNIEMQKLMEATHFGQQQIKSWLVHARNDSGIFESLALGVISQKLSSYLTYNNLTLTPDQLGTRKKTNRVIKSRGLPNEAIQVLKAWFHENLFCSCPDGIEKEILAETTKLTKKQVEDWVRNTRQKSGIIKSINEGKISDKLSCYLAENDLIIDKIPEEKDRYKPTKILKTWFHQHLLYPHPNEIQIETLAKTSGLTKDRVENWFESERAISGITTPLEIGKVSDKLSRYLAYYKVTLTPNQFTTIRNTDLENPVLNNNITELLQSSIQPMNTDIAAPTSVLRNSHSSYLRLISQQEKGLMPIENNPFWKKVDTEFLKAKKAKETKLVEAKWTLQDYTLEYRTQTRINKETRDTLESKAKETKLQKKAIKFLNDRITEAKTFCDSLIENETSSQAINTTPHKRKATERINDMDDNAPIKRTKLSQPKEQKNPTDALHGNFEPEKMKAMAKDVAKKLVDKLASAGTITVAKKDNIGINHSLTEEPPSSTFSHQFFNTTLDNREVIGGTNNEWNNSSLQRFSSLQPTFFSQHVVQNLQEIMVRQQASQALEEEIICTRFLQFAAHRQQVTAYREQIATRWHLQDIEENLLMMRQQQALQAMHNQRLFDQFSTSLPFPLGRYGR